MPERMTEGPGTQGRLSDPLSAVVRGLAVVLALAAAGAATGVVWEAVWDAPTGVVYQERWFLEPAGPDISFSGTALYVLLAVPVGLVVGAVAAALPRHEVVTTVAVLLGSVLGGWLMYAVGHALGPPDPEVLAAGKPDYTEVPADLVLASLGDSTSPFRSTAFVAFPLGALGGLAVVYLSGFRGRRHG